jgi:hypothetical protein
MLGRILSAAALAFFFPVGLSHAGVKDQVVYIEVLDGKKTVSKGSGFLIGDNGVIVTTRNVVEKGLEPNTSIRVALKSPDASTVPAIMWPCASKDSACLIKINTGNMNQQDFNSFLKLSCRKIKDDEAVEAMGYGPDPKSRALHVEGKVASGLGDGFLYSSSLTIAPGMSGGPVYDKRGWIIGILQSPQRDAGRLSLFIPIFQLHPELEKQNVECPSGGESIHKEALLVYTTSDGDGGLAVPTHDLKSQLELVAKWAAMRGVNAKVKYLFLDKFSSDYFSNGMSDAEIASRFNTEGGREFLKEMSTDRLFIQLARLQNIPGDQTLLQIRQVLIEIEWNGTVAKPSLTKLDGYPDSTDRGRYADTTYNEAPVSSPGQSNKYDWQFIARALSLALKDKDARLFANNKLAIPCPIFDGEESMLNWLLSIPEGLESESGKAWTSHPLNKYQIDRVNQQACADLYRNDATQETSAWKRYQHFKDKLFRQRMLTLPFIAIETDLEPDQQEEKKYSLRAWIRLPADKSFKLYENVDYAAELRNSKALSKALYAAVLKEARMKYDLIKPKP